MTHHLTPTPPPAAEVAATPKPCPFCGTEPELTSHGPDQWYVLCVNGGCPAVSYDADDTPQQAVARWNHRAPDPTLAAVVAERDRYRTALECIAEGQQPPDIDTTADDGQAMLSLWEEACDHFKNVAQEALASAAPGEAEGEKE